MGQQASLIKLKEQIEAAKRSLSEMSPVVTANFDGAPVSLVGVNSQERENASVIESLSIDSNKITDITAVGLPKTDELEGTKAIELNGGYREAINIKTDSANPSNINSEFEEFKFFHRKTQPKEASVIVLNKLSIDDADKLIEGKAEDPLFDDLDRRLREIEHSTAHNRMHINELIKISSQLVSAQVPSRSPKSMRRLIRRCLFWLVVGILATGWFALTPSGHEGINYLLNLK